MLQVYIYGPKESGFLDMFPDTSLEMESLKDLFDEDLSTGEYSLPVEFPWTDNNRRLWGFAERIENFTEQQSFCECTVFDEGFPEFIKAKITLLEKSGTWSYTRGKFNASITGNKGLFGTAIKNKSLKDLQLGGVISWTGSESRDFASDVMKGVYPQYYYLGFAPIVIENFFDTSKNYNDEFIVKNTVNCIMSTGAGSNDWKFARPTSADDTIPTVPGDAEHIDFRTIPFFKFKFLLIKAFEEFGYHVTGDILSSSDFEDLYFFNTTAIEWYTTATYEDYNRKIIPSEHMPDIKLVDFFKSVFAFFNIYPVFSGTSDVKLVYRKKIFSDRRVLNITDRCSPEFTGLYNDVSENNGFKVDYKWDDKDDYRSERVKEITGKTMVGTVATAANLATLDIGRDFTTDDIAFVEAENMYYNVANALSIPVLWDAWSEGLDAYQTGNGDRSVEAGMGTLCTYVAFNDADAVYERRDLLACRQAGTYMNNKFVKVKNTFGLSVFYIKKQPVAGNDIPVSFNHNTSAAGSVRVPYSLALAAPKGIVESFHKEWQKLQQSIVSIKETVRADKKLMAEMNEANTLQINNVLFLTKKILHQLPLQSTIELELVPL